MTGYTGVLATCTRKLTRIVMSCDPEFYRGRKVESEVWKNVEFCTLAAIISEILQANRRIECSHLRASTAVPDVHEIAFGTSSSALCASRSTVRMSRYLSIC